MADDTQQTQTEGQELTLENFAEHIIQEKDLGELQPEIYKQLKEDLVNRMETRLNGMIMRELPPEKLEEFDQMLDTASEEEIQQFTMEHIPDYDKKIGEELLQFKRTYLSA